MEADNTDQPKGLDEVFLVQNPALGAVLMWKFVEGYKRASPKACPSLPLLFLVLPIIFSEALRNQLSTTFETSGMRLFAAKFSKDQEELLAIQERMIMLRETSLSSVSIAIECGLLRMGHTDALVDCNVKHFPSGVPQEIKVLARLATKLGFWCGTLTLQEIQAALRIGF